MNKSKLSKQCNPKITMPSPNGIYCPIFMFSDFFFGASAHRKCRWFLSHLVLILLGLNKWMEARVKSSISEIMISIAKFINGAKLWYLSSILLVNYSINPLRKKHPHKKRWTTTRKKNMTQDNENVWHSNGNCSTYVLYWMNFSFLISSFDCARHIIYPKYVRFHWHIYVLDGFRTNIFNKKTSGVEEINKKKSNYWRINDLMFNSNYNFGVSPSQCGVFIIRLCDAYSNKRTWRPQQTTLS